MLSPLTVRARWRRCFFCKKQQFTVCDVTNPPFEEPAYSNTMEKLYGDRIAGMHGYRCI